MKINRNNILIISPDFNYCCGRSMYVYSLIKNLSAHGYKIHFLSNKGDSFERLNKYVNNIYVIDGFFNKNIISVIRNIVTLKNLIIRNQIDIIHSHHRVPDLLTSITVSLFNFKILTITTVHSILKKKYFLKYYSKDLIAVSSAVYNNLLTEFKINKKRISLIHNFLSLSNYSRANVKKENNFVNILSAGRLVDEKNYGTLIQAVSYIQDNYKIRLTIVGEGKEKKKLQDIAASLKVDLEIVNVQRDISFYILNTDICILTSKVESFPTFMLEAGFFCKPFIGSDIYGINDLIKNRNNGLLFKPEDSEDLSEKIKLFIENTDLAKKCSVNLNVEVMNQFTEEKIIPKVLKLYEKI